MKLPHSGFTAFAFLLAASACSPDAGSPVAKEGQGQAAPTNIQRSPEAAANETAANAATAAKPAGGSARRCGWLHNPTPANWWLTDRDGQWILATQGADQAPGMDEMPDMSAGEWVETNGYYGYGCACMTIDADADGKVLRVSEAAPKPLAQCRSDRSLPSPDPD